MAKGLSIVKITLKYEDGTPASGLLIKGLAPMENVENVVTANDGTASGYISDIGEHVISLENYIDCTWSDTIETVLGSIYKIDGTVTRAAKKIIMSSQSVYFSSKVIKIDYIVVGAGGGGGAGYFTPGPSTAGSGNGGGGGAVISVNDIAVTPHMPYAVSIGSGGNGGSGKTSAPTVFEGSAGSSGGTSSFMSTNASGGYGAYNDINRGSPRSASIGGAIGNSFMGSSMETAIYSASGASGGLLAFDSWYVGGGGGSGALLVYSGSSSMSNIKAGGQKSMSGGSGGSVYYNPSTFHATGYAGANAAYGGGGGGGGTGVKVNDTVSPAMSIGNGGRGGNGCVVIRCYGNE